MTDVRPISSGSVLVTDPVGLIEFEVAVPTWTPSA